MPPKSTEKTKLPGAQKGGRGNSTHYVFCRVRDMILNQDLRPGQNIDEQRIAKMCGVSRTPVREALYLLSAEGLVLLLQNRVTQVAELDTQTLQNYFESMDLIQRAANRWAALRRAESDLALIQQLSDKFDAAVARGALRDMVVANYDFHTAIGDAANNEFIADTYKRLLNIGLRVARFTLYPDKEIVDARDFTSSIQEEHADLIDAIAQRNTSRAERIALSHTDKTRDQVAKYLAISSGKSINIDPVDAPADAIVEFDKRNS
jgi:DNA-binding GntR family transcriptional regulator